jgi:DNA-binding NtrC family response regulator
LKKRKKILIVEDDKIFAEHLSEILNENLQLVFKDEKDDIKILTCNTYDSALKVIKKNIENLYTIIIDIHLDNNRNGFQLTEEIKKLDADVPIIIMTGKPMDVDTLQSLITQNIDDFKIRPSVDPNSIGYWDMLYSLKKTIEKAKVIKYNKILVKSIAEKSGIVGNHKKIKELYNAIAKAAMSDANVIITGPSGVGKELVAKTIYKLNKRRQGKFVEINAAAIPENLFESEFFGHVKGSFTGAIKDKIGKFELANNGTLFLDEIGDLSLSNQAKLLRVVQENTIVRVGDIHNIKINVRIIVATNKNLEDLIKKGKFREDLYYRLNVVPIYVPPLRERTDDIPLLIAHFLKLFNKRENKKVQIEKEAIPILKNYSWSGNVRELSNFIERIVSMEEENAVLAPDHIDKILSNNNDKKENKEVQIKQEATPMLKNYTWSDNIRELSNVIEKIVSEEKNAALGTDYIDKILPNVNNEETSSKSNIDNKLTELQNSELRDFFIRFDKCYQDKEIIKDSHYVNKHIDNKDFLCIRWKNVYKICYGSGEGKNYLLELMKSSQFYVAHDKTIQKQKYLLLDRKKLKVFLEEQKISFSLFK